MKNKLFAGKHGQAGLGLKAGALISLVITLVIAFSVIAQTADDVADASYDISNTTDKTGASLPFAGFFASGGVVMLGFMAAIALGVFGSLGLLKGR